MSLQFAFTDPSGAATTWRQKGGYLPETPSSRRASYSTNGKIYKWATRFTHEPIAQAGIQGLPFGQYPSDIYYKKHELSPYINDPLSNINMLATEGSNPNPIAGSNAFTNSLISPGGAPLTWSALNDIDLHFRFKDNPYRPGDPLSPQYALAMEERNRGNTRYETRRFLNPRRTIGEQRKRSLVQEGNPKKLSRRITSDKEGRGHFSQYVTPSEDLIVDPNDVLSGVPIDRYHQDRMNVHRDRIAIEMRARMRDDDPVPLFFPPLNRDRRPARRHPERIDYDDDDDISQAEQKQEDEYNAHTAENADWVVTGKAEVNTAEKTMESAVFLTSLITDYYRPEFKIFGVGTDIRRPTEGELNTFKNSESYNAIPTYGEPTKNSPVYDGNDPVGNAFLLLDYLDIELSSIPALQQIRGRNIDTTGDNYYARQHLTNMYTNGTDNQNAYLQAIHQNNSTLIGTLLYKNQHKGDIFNKDQSDQSDFNRIISSMKREVQKVYDEIGRNDLRNNLSSAVSVTDMDTNAVRTHRFELQPITEDTTQNPSLGYTSTVMPGKSAVTGNASQIYEGTPVMSRRRSMDGLPDATVVASSTSVGSKIPIPVRSNKSGTIPASRQLQLNRANDAINQAAKVSDQEKSIVESKRVFTKPRTPYRDFNNRLDSQRSPNTVSEDDRKTVEAKARTAAAKAREKELIERRKALRVRL